MKDHPPPPDGASPSADCPGCGRFIGPEDECPYCGVEPAGRRPLRLLRRGALVFAVGGLVVLLVSARRSELPSVPVSSLDPAMNFARIRIAGTVSSPPRVFDKQGIADYASFELDDGTGRIMVAASRRAARLLIENNSLPARGDRIEVSGSVRLTPDRRARLYLDSPAQLKRLPRKESS